MLTRYCLLLSSHVAGKSSILNTLSPSLQLAVNSLSRKAQGRHTTTQTILHALESGGEIIDSPGFQNYQPPAIPVKEVTQGFREFQEPAKLSVHTQQQRTQATRSSSVRVQVTTQSWLTLVLVWMRLAPVAATTALAAYISTSPAAPFVCAFAAAATPCLPRPTL